MSEIIKGLVICASHNIISIRVNPGNKEYECRIKGKILKGCDNFYNPIAPGDWVIAECQKDSNNNKAQVLSVEKRHNYFSRFNQKGSKSQLLAANADLVLCITTPASPPFRPRFLDRVLLQADIAEIETIVICNKMDLDNNDTDINERLEEYKRIGYRLLEVSAKTGKGIEELRSEIKGKTCILTGQSGVGKSSIINALQPGLNIKEGSLNEKYNRGVHTTTLSYMFELDDNTRIIDTPGVRLFIPDGINVKDLIFNMREFAPIAGKCSYGISCTHINEPGCRILEAVAAGVIHEDRYESFLRITEDLKGINNA